MEVNSIQDVAANQNKTKVKKPLPDFNLLHDNLTKKPEEYGDALDYLEVTRGISSEVIDKMKIGALRASKENLFIIIPYYNKGKPVFYKGRSVPTTPGADRHFLAPTGYEVPLFNGDALDAGHEELFIVEGEMDALTLMSQGFDNVVAVPGASMKKAEWVEHLDTLTTLKKIYLVYDRDKAGQEGAKALATRLASPKVRNVLLPEFYLPLEEGQTELKQGKDINEWFTSGRTVIELQEVLEAAKPIGVEGVTPLVEVIREFLVELESGASLKPKYDTCWAKVNEKIGGFDDGDLIGILADAKVGKTTAMLNLADYYAKSGYRPFFDCEEMLPKRVVRKWISYVTQTPDNPFASKITKDVVQEALSIGAGYPGDLCFGYSGSRKTEDIFAMLRRAIRMYGFNMLFFDNLYLLVRKIENQHNEVAVLGAMFKELAMEMKIPVFLILQPHRVSEGQIVGKRNIMGSSMIEKHVDGMITFHRNSTTKISRESEFTGYEESDSNLDPYMLCKLEATRYAGGGNCTLYMQGDTSTVRDLNANDSMKSPAALESQYGAVAA